MNHCKISPSQQIPMKAEDCRPGAIVHPTEMDIILGRGVLHAGHKGNQRFYAIIDKYLPLYDLATSRAEKTKVVQTIFDTITSVGRFVKDDVESAACVVIETKKAKKKISHAIRFRRQQAGKCSLAAEARRLHPVKSSPKASPPLHPSVKKPQGLQQQRPQFQCKPDSLHGFMQEKFVASRNRPNTTRLDCIIPDEDLESVLLLSPGEIEHVSQTYGDLLWQDLNENRGSNTKEVTASPLSNLRNTPNSTLQKSPQLPGNHHGIPNFRPLPLPPRFVSKPPPKEISSCVDDTVPPPNPHEDPLDLLISFESEDHNMIVSLALGEDVLALPPRFPHPSIE